MEQEDLWVLHFHKTLEQNDQDKRGGCMMTTKNMAKAQIGIMINLLLEARKLGEELRGDLASDKELAATMLGVLTGQETDEQEIIAYLEKRGCFEGMKDGGKCDTATVNVVRPDSVEIFLSSGSGSLVAWSSTSDDATPQAGVVYRRSDGTILDLAFAEVKKGKLAEIAGRPADNEDIDIYLYGDPYEEGYTSHTAISQVDIAAALSD